MKYLCLAYGNREKMESLSNGEMESLRRECMPYMDELHKTGQLFLDGGLEWESTTVRPRNGAAFVTDGPFVETKEQVGGAFIIDARDLNEAIRLASLHPAAHIGEHLGWAIEIRPFAMFDKP